MRVADDSLVLSPTDLSAFLTCRHRTGLDLAVARGVLNRPTAVDPFAAILQRLGEEHEQRYVMWLRSRGLRIVEISGEAERPALRTIQAMRAGADVIVQARLEGADLAGYADILLRVNEPGVLGAWSYEVQDTKLARETKGGTILQLSVYSALLSELQGRTPERFHVVTPAGHELESSSNGGPATVEFAVHSYRVEDYTAYFRMVLASLRAAAGQGHDALTTAHYPEPVDACNVCRWEARCERRRRADDHLSFIANTGRLHRVELTAQGRETLASAAAMPVPVTFEPSRGARETYNRIGNQARVQHRQREERRPIFERLPIAAGEGLCRLPAPSPGDVFLDLEGARFAREGGREYLFGVWNGGEYRACWATSDVEEKAAFEWVIDLIMDAWTRTPGMHVYHFNHYEPAAFKKLMGRHATRAEALDQLLRAERFVDLYPVTRQAVRAGVESYSIKKLEAFTGYSRAIDLAHVNQALTAAELALESGAPETIPDDIRTAVQGYNEDDCRSTAALRDWLERLREACIADGEDVPRPETKSGEPSQKISELQAEATAIRECLLDGLPDDAGDPAHPEHHRWLLAYLVDFHKREENAEWWDYFRLLDLPEDELLDEKKAIVGLEYVSRIQTVTNKKTGKPTGSIVDRYRYPSQEVEIGGTASLKLQNQQHFGAVFEHDREARTIDIKKGKETAELHPRVMFCSDVISTAVQQKAVMRLASQMREGCGMDLLLRRPPRLRSGRFQQAPDESTTEFALRIVTELDATTLAVQGPPGAGKTYTGARMIRAFVRQGKRVGVTAGSHKVIRNLLDELRNQCVAAGEHVRLGHKVGSGEVSEPGDPAVNTREFGDNAAPLEAIRRRDIDVLGGTPFLWAREEFASAVDVLFVDEAGQMSLANALAVSHATDSLVLLGDPQQLEQPQKGSHPDGVSVSALDHVLGGAKTMPEDRGLFLPTTWRLAPSICAFTSEAFYEAKLYPKPGLERHRLEGAGPFDGAGLWLVPAEHDGNQNWSIEEVDIVDRIVTGLLSGGRWMNEDGIEIELRPGDFRIVAPFNAQVNRLTERLGHLGIPVGTVDKFQGQTAAVAIYSMTTSRPEDAPRGMEFLYSLNRLNVATSRARCAVFLVASPRLFEPECRTPRQMQLANALCRYREMARMVVPADLRMGCSAL